MTEVYRTHEAIQLVQLVFISFFASSFFQFGLTVNQIVPNRSLDKKITMLNMDLVEARGSRETHFSDRSTPSLGSSGKGDLPKKKMLMVIGINTAFSSRRRRDSVRETWMPRGICVPTIAFMSRFDQLMLFFG